MNKYDVVRMS